MSLPHEGFRGEYTVMLYDVLQNDKPLVQDLFQDLRDGEILLSLLEILTAQHYVRIQKSSFKICFVLLLYSLALLPIRLYCVLIESWFSLLYDGKGHYEIYVIKSPV